MALWLNLGGGKLEAVIIARLSKEMRPKDLRLILDELFIQEKAKGWLGSIMHGSPPPPPSFSRSHPARYGSAKKHERPTQTVL